MSLKERCADLISDYRNGTKSVAKTAEKELIKICEPIVRLRYGIAKKYNQEIVEIGKEYDPSSGRIERIYEIRENPETIITFQYYDPWKDSDGNEHEYKAYINFPMSWLDEDADVKFEKQCRKRKIDYLLVAIAYQRSNLQNMEDDLHELLKEEEK